jgi:hypothetical protein
VGARVTVFHLGLAGDDHVSVGQEVLLDFGAVDLGAVARAHVTQHVAILGRDDVKMFPRNGKVGQNEGAVCSAADHHRVATQRVLFARVVSFDNL